MVRHRPGKPGMYRGMSESVIIPMATGRPHRNPDGTVVPTPHVKEAGVKGVRPARPEELP